MTYIQLLKSKVSGKKYTAIFYDEKRTKIKTLHFGAAGMSDFTKLKDEGMKQRYIARHEKNEKWNDYMTAGSLSRWILWHKPSVSASYNDYIKKFGLKKY